MDDLQVYREAVQLLLSSENPGVVANARKEHARVIIEELLDHSKRTFYAIASHLSGDVWSASVLEKLRNAIKRGVTVRLVVEDDIQQDDNLCDIKDHIHKINKDKKKPPFNVAVMDGIAFRFETDKENRKAVLCANNRVLAEKLDNIVSEYFRTGSAVCAG